MPPVTILPTTIPPAEEMTTEPYTWEYVEPHTEIFTDVNQDEYQDIFVNDHTKLYMEKTGYTEAPTEKEDEQKTKDDSHQSELNKSKGT